jgi:hypothetical protein
MGLIAFGLVSGSRIAHAAGLAASGLIVMNGAIRLASGNEAAANPTVPWIVVPAIIALVALIGCWREYWQAATSSGG